MNSAPSGSAVRDELGRILASERFSRAEQLTRFLTFTVDEALGGRAEAIKESVLGMEVFGRGSSFDPRIDPIVRVTARKLRNKLEEYYANEGASDPLIIEFPKGTYVPSMRVVEPAIKAPDTTPRARTHRWPLLAAGLALVLTAAAAITWQANRTPAAPTTVAVLAFADLSEQKDQQYLGDGLAEDLIDALAQAPELRVIARTSSFQFGRTPADAREVGRRLGAQMLVEGSVRQSGGRVKVTAQVIEAKNGQHVWSGSFEHTGENVLQLQDEIARAIARELGGSLGLATARAKPGTTNVEAYHAYLRGRFFNSQGRNEDVLKEYRHAVALDPRYADGHGGIAHVLLSMRTIAGVDMDRTLQEARREAELAMRLDRSSFEAQRAMAGVLEAEVDWKGAEAAYRNLVLANPGSPRAHQVYARFMGTVGDPERAVSAMREALKLDPLSIFQRNDLARGLFFARRYPEAIAEANAGLELRQRDELFLAPLSLAHQALGHHAEAVAAARRCVELQKRSSFSLGLLGHALALAGKGEEAREILRELEKRAERERVQSTVFARMHLGLGDRKRALEYLENAAAAREPMLIFHYHDQRFDPLRTDARFVALYRRVGLPYNR